MPQGPSFWFDTRLYLSVTAVLLLIIVYYNHYIALLGLIILVALYLYGRERYKERQKALAAYIENISMHVQAAGLQAFDELPVGMAMIDEQGIILWHNHILLEWLEKKELLGLTFKEVLPECTAINLLVKNGQTVVSIGKKYYRVTHKYIDNSKNGQKPYTLLYFMDITSSQLLREQCQGAMPVLAYIQIDNHDDVLKGLTDSQRGAVLAEVHARLDEWVNDLNGVIKKYADDLYLAIFNRTALEKILADKFDILDNIRTVQEGNKIPVTLSIGVAVDEPTISAMGQRAQAGLDLALGRGGDQAAVYIEGKVQFYGGKTKAVEKNTRVKARIVAQALHELISDAEQVLIMGHANEDYDSLGGAIGVAKMAMHLGKPVYIVVSQVSLAVNKLMEIMPEYEEYKGIFITGLQAQAMANNSLLFIVDTHRPELTAAPELLNLVDRKVVIDHHRRSESFIQTPLLVYLEPSASSTSELVAELLLYFDDKLEFNRLEATALYAGIIVDTKSFAVQTGVRTFEAASFLRRSGADPAMVKNLFKVDFDTVVTRAHIIASAEKIANGIVIGVCAEQVKNAQIIAAQAADMLLNIEGTVASFVLTSIDDSVFVSARSNGDINVQVLMEELGGGGHQSVAGAQIRNTDINTVKALIVSKIKTGIEESEDNESNS